MKYCFFFRASIITVLSSAKYMGLVGGLNIYTNMFKNRYGFCKIFKSFTLSVYQKDIWWVTMKIYLAWWKIKGCLLKMKKERIFLGKCMKKYHRLFCVTNSRLLEAWVSPPCLIETIFPCLFNVCINVTFTELLRCFGWL